MVLASRINRSSSLHTRGNGSPPILVGDGIGLGRTADQVLPTMLRKPAQENTLCHRVPPKKITPCTKEKEGVSGERIRAAPPLVRMLAIGACCGCYDEISKASGAASGAARRCAGPSAAGP